MEDHIDLMDPLAVDDAVAILPEVLDEDVYAPETVEPGDAGELEDTDTLDTSEMEGGERQATRMVGAVWRRGRP